MKEGRGEGGGGIGRFSSDATRFYGQIETCPTSSHDAMVESFCSCFSYFSSAPLSRFLKETRRHSHNFLLIDYGSLTRQRNSSKKKTYRLSLSLSLSQSQSQSFFDIISNESNDNHDDGYRTGTQSDGSVEFGAGISEANSWWLDRNSFMAEKCTEL